MILSDYFARATLQARQPALRAKNVWAPARGTAMGIKKTGKKLMKIGKKAAKSLGKSGSEFVEAVLQTAIGTLETELKKKGATSGKKPVVQAAKQPQGPAPARSSSARRRLTQGGVKSGVPVAKAPHRLASTTSRAAGEQPHRPRAAASAVEESRSPV